MAKPEYEFTSVKEFPSIQSTNVEGLSEKILAKDPDTNVVTRILQFEPGTDTSENGVQIHDFWEELYIIEGSIRDLVLNEDFNAGMFACRPPGMKHGPWKSENGCKIFEVRYYTK